MGFRVVLYGGDAEVASRVGEYSADAPDHVDGELVRKSLCPTGFDRPSPHVEPGSGAVVVTLLRTLRLGGVNVDAFAIAAWSASLDGTASSLRGPVAGWALVTVRERR
jgi:hypothetical protein